MTLSMAWVRTLRSRQELVFASDSRLRGGEAWDCCPKILRLPRTDALLSFAGATWRAYPMMLQLISGIEFYPPSRDRRTDIAAAAQHCARIVNQMVELVADL